MLRKYAGFCVSNLKKKNMDQNKGWFFASFHIFSFVIVCSKDLLQITTTWYYNSRQLGLLQITTTGYYNSRQVPYYNSRQLLLQFTTVLQFTTEQTRVSLCVSATLSRVSATFQFADSCYFVL